MSRRGTAPAGPCCALNSVADKLGIAVGSPDLNRNRVILAGLLFVSSNRIAEVITPDCNDCDAKALVAIVQSLNDDVTADIHEAGCRALRNILAHGSPSEQQKRARNASALEALVACLRRSQSNASLVMEACATIVAIIKSNTQSQGRAHQAGVIPAVQAAMLVHPYDADLQTYACEVIANCLGIFKETTAHQEARDGGAVEAVVTVMQRHGGIVDVQVNGMGALQAMLPFVSQQTRAFAVDHHVPEVVVTALSTHPSNEKVLITGSALVYGLARGNPSHEAMRTHPVLKALLAGLTLQINNESVVASVSGAIQRLLIAPPTEAGILVTDDSAWQKTVCEAGAIEVLHACVVRHMRQQNVCDTTWQCLAILLLQGGRIACDNGLWETLRGTIKCETTETFYYPGLMDVIGAFGFDRFSRRYARENGAIESIVPFLRPFGAITQAVAAFNAFIQDRTGLMHACLCGAPTALVGGCFENEELNAVFRGLIESLFDTCLAEGAAGSFA